MNETNADVKGYALGALEVASGEVETNEHNPDGLECCHHVISPLRARIAELERRVKEEESKRKETAKDFETAFRIVRLENDQLRAEVERLTKERDEARAQRDEALSQLKSAMDDVEQATVAHASAEEDRALLLETVSGIADADYRKWDKGFNTPEEFVKWAKNRARHAIRAARAQPEDGK